MSPLKIQALILAVLFGNILGNVICAYDPFKRTPSASRKEAWRMALKRSLVLTGIYAVISLLVFFYSIHH